MTQNQINEAQDRQKIIQEAIDRFLDDNDLELTKNNKEKLHRNLTLWFQEKSPLSTSFIYNYLQETLEYQEFNIQKQQGTGDIADETAIINILINTDPRRPATKLITILRRITKPLMLVYLLITLSYSVIYTQRHQETAQMQIQQISVMEANSLKNMVKEITEISTENGQPISTAAVWAMIKKAPSITNHGTTKSYKNFNRAQYLAAQTLLNTIKQQVLSGNTPNQLQKDDITK